MAQRDPWEIYAASSATAQADPWQVSAAPAPSSIAGPPKIIDPLEAERLDLSRQSGARDQTTADRTQTNTQFDNITSMRKEFTSRKPVADYTLVLPQVASAMKIAGSGKATGADDLNLIYTFGKVMDPGSVVREGELALASDTGSFAQSMEGAAQKLRNGEKLPDAVRRNLVETMRRRGIELANSYNLERSTFKELAERNGFDPFEVVGMHPAEPFQQAEADFTKHTIGNFDGSVGARPEGYKAPVTPLDPAGQGDIGFNVKAEDQASVTPQQEQAFAAFFKNNPKATPDQIQAFAGAIGYSGTINNADELAKYYAAGGTGFGGVKELTPKAVKDAAAKTVDGSVGSSVVAGVADSVPFAPQIGAVADTLGFTPGRPTVWDGEHSIGDTYEFNRDANEVALTNAAKAHPLAYAGGQAAGMLAGGAVASRAVPALGRLGTWAADGSLSAQIAKSAPLEAGYGALYGAGRNPDDPLKGALNNGLAAAGGGALGRGVVGTVGAVVAPAAGRLGPLYQNGVRPTVGQKLGGAANWAEEMAGSVPFVGGVVRGARQQARGDFERGAFNQALSEIGARLPADMDLGTAPHAFMQDAFNVAYDTARSGMQFVPDRQFQSDLSNFSASIRNGVLDGTEIQQIAAVVNNAIGTRLQNSGGRLAGDAYKTASSDIAKTAQRLSATNPNLAESVAEFGQIVDNAARRNSVPEAVDLLDAADRGYAQAVRIEKAAATRAGDPGRFTPTQFDGAVQSASGGVRSRSYLRGDALMGDYAEAGRALVDRFPNSGTPERGALMGVLAGGLGYVSPVGAGVAALGMGAYAPGVRNIVSSALAPRQTPQLNTLGNLIRRNAALGGGAGAAGGLAMLPGSAPNGN